MSVSPEQELPFLHGYECTYFLAKASKGIHKISFDGGMSWLIVDG